LRDEAPLKVAILSYTFPRGMGYIGNMLPRHLARLGADVHYLTMDLPHYFQSEAAPRTYGEFEGGLVTAPGSVEALDGFTLHGLAHRVSLGQRRYVGLADKLAALRPDVVQSLIAIGWPPLDTALLQRRFGYRLFTGNHTHASVFPLAMRDSHWWEPARLRNLATRFLPGRFISRHTEKCYAPAPDCADVAVRFFGVERHKIALVPLGVDTDRFRPALTEAEQARRLDTRAELGFRGGDVVFVYTGQFTEGKNPLLLAQAVARLAAAGRPARGLFVGNGPQAAAIAAVGSCVTVHDFVPNAELVRFYQAADVAVWPTQESTSMLDAAACGLPLVVNDTVQVTERIDGNGVTYRLNDLDDLVRVMEVALDPAWRRTLGETGARRMRDQFSWADLARRRLRDYEAACR
jgi:glycosyltransferase involved in cell wall biosynthesis